MFDFIKFTGAISALLWLRPKRLYESKAAKKHVRGKAVVVSNHTDISDPISLYCTFWYRRPHTLAMKEIFTKKISNWFFRSALCIPVDRENFNMDTYRACTDALLDNRMLVIFPEGAINHDDTTVQSFKSGAVLIALKAKAPIVPVYLTPRRKWYNRSIIVVGEPIDIAKMCEGTPGVRVIDQVTQLIHEKDIKLMEVYNNWKSKKSSK